MAKDVITRFKLETTQYDSKIKEAAKELSAYSKTATQAKEGFNQFTKANVDAARALGSMETSATNVKDKVKELVGAFNDAAKAYNALSDEQKQSDWAKALSGSLTQLQQRIKETKAEIQGLGDGMKDGGGGLFAGLGGKMSGALQVFGGNLLTKGAGMLAGLASEMGDMVKQGIELARQGEGIRIAFERLGRGDILDGLRQATHGTVTDLELMKAAVKFNDFNLPLSELGTMLAFAQQKAKDTGQSVDYMVDSIVTGLGRKSLMILDNLGLSATEIKDRMAETGDMTKAVGDIIRDQMSKAGDYVETAADRAAQANVSLQNKMEELGRKFAPVEEASSQLWTSMKIGILDIVGGPLARLLNGLTEAGRLKNMLDDLNGGEDGKPTEVDRQVNRVKTLKRAGGNERAVNTFASGIIEDYNRQIMALDAKIKDTKKLSPDQQASKFVRDEVQKMGEQMKALGIMRDQFAAAVKDLTKPVDVSINTSKAEQNVETLRMKLIELEAQRKKAVKEGDQTQVKSLTQQINATKTNIRALDPTALKTGTTSTSPQQRAEEQVKDALSKYNDTIGLATKQMEAGNITEAEFKSQMLSQQQRLYDAYGQAYRVYADPKYKDAQKQTADEIVRLGGEVKAATEAQKKTQESARQLEQAQKELAKYEKEAADAMSRNDLTAYFAAMEKVKTSKNKVTQLTSPTDSHEEELAKARKVQSTPIAPKEFNISANDEEALAKARKIDSVKITPKEFVVTAETAEAMSQLREVMGEQLPDKEFIISATDESLPLMKAIDGVSIQPKTFVVTAETDEAMSQLREVMGEQVPDKEFIISATDESLPLMQAIESVSIKPKTFVVTAETDEAMAKLSKVVGAKISNKEFIISASDEEALAKARKIDNVKITPKEFTITADDEEALAKVLKFLGIKLAPKEFTISANDEEALAKARKIDSVKITPKEFVVTAETAEAMSQLREVMGEQLPDKEFIISATDESLPLMQAIESVSIKPKTFSVTADTAEAMSQLREVVGEQVPDKEFIISATDESLPLMQAIDGVSIQPKTYVVTAETDDAMSQIREVMGEQVPDKTFIISATDESLPLLQAIEGVSITPKEFIVTANTEQAQESIKKLDALSQQTEESLAKPRKPQGKQNATTPNFTLTQNNLQGFIASVQKQMGDTSLTTDLFGDLTSQLNDAKMLSSAIQTAIKNGLDPAALGLDNIWKQVFNINPGDYIDDSQWEELRKKLEESIGKPIEINFKTGEMKTLTNDAKTTEKSFREAASAVSSVSSALSQLEDPGAKIAGIIGQAIANIALGFAQATAASSGGGIFGWIAAITGGLATMISTISAIHNATGYAQGGIVKGSTYSGDRVQGLVDGVTPVGLNAGEVVLNHSQQATLAAELADRDNGGGTSSRPYVDAETIYLGVSNYLKRSGRGEIVTTKK